MEKYIKDIVFKDNKDLYNELIKLSEDIKKTSFKTKPFLIEFIGTCRSGKSTSIDLIQDVLIKNGLKVLVVDEEYVKLTKEINYDRNKKMNIDSLDYTNNIIEEKITIYDKTCYENYDVIIYDRGINDEFIWLNVFGASSSATNEYDEKLKERKINLLIIMTCSVETTLKRKYLNSLSVMPSKWTNSDVMTKYLESLNKTNKYFNNHSNFICKINTDDKDKVNVALEICKEIIKYRGEL